MEVRELQGQGPFTVFFQFGGGPRKGTVTMTSLCSA